MSVSFAKYVRENLIGIEQQIRWGISHQQILANISAETGLVRSLSTLRNALAAQRKKNGGQRQKIVAKVSCAGKRLNTDELAIAQSHLKC